MADTEKPEKSSINLSPETKTTASTSPQSINAKTSAGQAANKDNAETDAIALLKEDHRRVEKLFADYERASGRTEKRKLVDQICRELEIHTELEESIFYPACRAADGDDDMLDEAQTAKLLIAELHNGEPQAPFYDAKVKVLAEYIKHHVSEEEGAQGIFARAKDGKADLNALGQELKEHKQELMEHPEAAEPRLIALESIGGRQFRSTYTTRKENTMPRQNYDYREDERSRTRARDEEGRFMSSRGNGGRGRDDDYDDRSGRSRNGGNGGRERDDEGRFMTSRGNGGRGRDDDYEDRGGRSRNGGNGSRERDDEGRFMSSRGNGRGRGDDYEDDRGGRRDSNDRGGWKHRSMHATTEDCSPLPLALGPEPVP